MAFPCGERCYAHPPCEDVTERPWTIIGAFSDILYRNRGLRELMYLK